MSNKATEGEVPQVREQLQQRLMRVETLLESQRNSVVA